VATETDLELSDGRALHFYNTGADDADGRRTVFWHHGATAAMDWLREHADDEHQA
jgi:hypothetical protein